MSLSSKIPIVEPVFIHEGFRDCCPIPRDISNIKSAEIPRIKAIDGIKNQFEEGYDMSLNAQRMMKGDGSYGKYSRIYIPFSSSSTMKGAYICIDGHSLPPSYLIFTFTSSRGYKTSKKYEFPGFGRCHWYYLSISLPDVVLCEITGKGREEEHLRHFNILSLVFLREETSQEIISREVREKLWSEAPVVKPKFVKKGDWMSSGRKSIPIPRDDPKIINPAFSMIKCKDASKNAQRMLKGEYCIISSHISIPFSSPYPVKGAFICVGEHISSPSLLFTFIHSDGMKTYKKYEFTKMVIKHEFEWLFLPIDLENVILCEIEGKGTWKKKESQWLFDYAYLAQSVERSALNRTVVGSSPTVGDFTTCSLNMREVKDENSIDAFSTSL
ncbi:hypothetical protein ADUPG1_009412 [Aduncisulcus paluster]|uniref:Uncharacterized protein n=1 Tax=Aduncisulcus paluster TaxID=2918883 RepID=A0ABQ5KYC1_9EUKA|nr:hypothetical protein ADUPG1_009412 [Aduncisulcus paluster]